MKLLFFSVTKHQYRYFKILGKHLSFEYKQLFFPSLKLSFKALQFYKKLDIEEILHKKYTELQVKYPNPIHRWFYMQFLKMQIPLLVSTLYHELKGFSPKYIILWNGKKFHQAISVVVADFLHIDIIYFENGLLPHTTTMDFKGVNASNSLPRTYTFYQNLHFDKNRHLPTSIIPRTNKTKQKIHHTSVKKPYIFVPFQVAYDTQILQHSPYFKNMYHLYEILEWLCKHTSITFVIKEHPSDRVSDYSSLHTNKHPKILFSSNNTQQLIENAEAVMSINSSVILESLLFKKRVIVLGEAFFAIDGIVKTAHSKQDILTILNHLETWETDNSVIDNFLKYLYYTYLIPHDWRDPQKEHFNAIERRIKEHLC